MNDRHEEIECYECGRLKTRLIWKGRCVTCAVQRLEFNLEENDTLRCENAALEARVAQLEGALALMLKVHDLSGSPEGDVTRIARAALKEQANEG